MWHGLGKERECNGRFHLHMTIWQGKRHIYDGTGVLSSYIEEHDS